MSRSRPRATFRPRFECLEERTVPSTTTVLTVSPDPGTAGQAVNLIASVTDDLGQGGFGMGTPPGTVTFFDGSTQLAPPTPMWTMYTPPGSDVGMAQLTLILPVGVHSLTAKYSGDFGSYQVGNAVALINSPGSTSDPVSEVINPATPAEPKDVTALVSVTTSKELPGGRELVTLRNVSGQAIEGPLFLVLSDLPGRVNLKGRTGITRTHAVGSPFLEDNVTLLPGGSLSLVLAFRNPLHRRVHFNLHVFAGGGTL